MQKWELEFAMVFTMKVIWLQVKNRGKVGRKVEIKSPAFICVLVVVFENDIIALDSLRHPAH